MKIFLITCLAFCFYSFMCQTEPEIIFWSKDNSLKWINFKGLPDANNKHAAITDCNIKMDFKTKKDTLFVSIIPYMSPNKSWVKTNEQNVILLKHEQIHFDITELFARKFRQVILNKKFLKAKLSDELKSISTTNNLMFKSYQSLYDTETDHSRIKSKQLEWEKKIAKELKDLEAYSNTDLKILLK